MKRIILALSFLCLSATALESHYTVGVLDTITSGGTGFNNPYGYTISSFTNYITASACAMQPDGKIVAVGTRSFINSGNPERAIVTRYRIDGTLDTAEFNNPYGGWQSQINATLSTHYNVTLSDVVVQPDGGIVVVGSATNLTNYPTTGAPIVQSLLVARLTPTSTPDTTFNSTGYVLLNIGQYIQANGSGNPTTTSADIGTAVAIDPWNNIIVSGQTTITQNDSRSPIPATHDIFVLQFNSSGVLNTSFNSAAVVGGTNSASVITAPGIGLMSLGTDSLDIYSNGMGIDASGNIVVVGNANVHMLVARFLNTGETQGELDTANFNSEGTPGYLSFATNYGGGTYDIATAVAFQSAGRIIVVGTNGPQAIFAGITSSGTLDTETFGDQSNSPGYTVNGWTGSTPIPYGVVVQSDDSIVMSGMSNSSGGTSDFVLDAYSADGSSQLYFTNTSITNPSFGRGLSIQQNGSFVVPGTVDTSNTKFAVARYLGVPVEGAMDLYYNPSSSDAGWSVNPTVSATTDQPQVLAVYPLSGDSAGNAYVAAETNNGSQVSQIDADGMIVGAPVTLWYGGVSLDGISDVVADSENKAVVVGSADGYGYIARYANVAGTMTVDSTFNGGVVALNSDAFLFNRVGYQSTGRYVAIGQAATDTNGILTAYNGNGTLASGSFGNNEHQGFNITISAVFCDLIIDNDNFIYVAYQNNASSGTGAGNICIAKYTADASNFVTDFGVGGIIDTGWSNGISGTPSITFDIDGNVVVAAMNLDASLLTFQAYTSTGSVLTSGGLPASLTLLSNFVLTKLQGDTNGRIIYTGYDDNNFIVGRLINGEGAYLQDTTFAPYSTCPSIAKVNYNDNNPTNKTSLTAPYRFSNTVCINGNGAILFGGYENITSSSTVALVGQVIGSTNPEEAATQVNRFPGASNSDGTLVNETPLNLNTSASLSGQPQALYTFGSGTFNGYTLIVTISDTGATLSMVDATTYALNTSTGATSFGDGSGQVILSNLNNATSILVAVDGSIYVLGMDNSDTPLVVLCKVSSNGLSQSVIYPIIRYDNEVDPVYAFTQAFGMVQQASGRILICGYNSSFTAGLVFAFDPYLNDGTGGMDLSFAPSGGFIPGCYLLAPGSNPITAIAVGETSNIFGDADQIYFAQAEYSDDYGYIAVVSRILENGTQLDPYFGRAGGQWIANVTDPNQICMQLNAVGENAYIVLAANTSTGIQAARFDRSNGVLDIDPFVVIPSTEGLALEEMLCLSDGTTLILASNGSTLDIARLTSAFAADPNFNSSGTTTGVLSTTVPATSPTQVQFWAMDVLGNDGQGIIVAGDDNTNVNAATPYLTQVISSASVTKYPQTASATPTPGIVDGTFNPVNTICGNAPGCLNLHNGISYSANDETINQSYPLDVIPTVLLQNSNGSYYIAGSDSYGTGVALMSDDDVQLPFGQGGNGMLVIPNFYNVSNMMITQDGFLIICGTGANEDENVSWIAAVNPFIGFPYFIAFNNLEVNCAMAQQSNGRILVAGSNDGVATILAFNSVDSRGGEFDTLDTTFARNGIYALSDYGTINSILVDANDNIYIIANNCENHAHVISLNQSGREVNWRSCTLASHSTSFTNNHLAFNQAGDIVAVAVDTTCNTIHAHSYTIAGDDTNLFSFGNGTTGITNPNVTSLAIDLNTSPGKIVLAGFDSATSPATPFVLRTTADEVCGLDTTFTSGCGTAGVVTTKHFGAARMIGWYDAIINADGKITVAGIGCHNSHQTPYLARFYGDEFIGQYEQPVVAGTPGTLDLNFPADDPSAPTAGYLTLTTSSTGQPVVVLPIANGSQYVGFSDGTIVRYTNDNILDSCFGDGGYAVQAPNGLTSMILDGKGCLVVVGTDSARREDTGRGWITRYVAGNNGTLDCHFNGGDVKYIEHCQAANSVIEQSMARLIVAGQLNIHGPRRHGNINGALFGLTHDGCPDATFSIYSESGVGVLDSGIELPGYAIVADQFDRLLVAYPNSPCARYVNLTRFTSSGELDYCFGCENATIRHILPSVEDPSQVRIVLDANNNIVVAANTDCGIKVVAYANTTGVNLTASALNISGSLTSPTLTGLIASADGNVLLCGNQDGMSMWVARVNIGEGYQLDTTFAPSGLTPGIMLFNIGQDQCDLAPIAIYGTGEITMVGYDVTTPQSFMSRAYNNPYTWQQPICLDSLPIGNVDETFGVTNNVGNGITFWASCDGTSQSAKAAALVDDDNIVMALDGSQSESGSKIYINMFDVDGLLNRNFNENGRATVLCQYDNQYVNDMVVFTTLNGCNKAILAGYAQNSTPSLTGSLLLQYNLDSAELDGCFGGLNGNRSGVAFGDASSLNTVALQSNGRIIAGGNDYSGNGLLAGYTNAGNLDQSFGQGGIFIQGSTGIYASAIDSQDRLVIAYNDGSNYIALARILADGSALDTSFAYNGIITGDTDYRIGIISGNSNIRLAINRCGNIVIAGIVNDGTAIAINVWNESGSEILASREIQNESPYNLSLTNFTMTKLLVDQHDYVVIVGYDSDGSTVVVRTKGDLCFDETFNANGTPGYIKYMISGDQQSMTTGAFIHPDGRIIILGSETTIVT